MSVITGAVSEVAGLIIDDVVISDRSVYLCMASNTILPGIYQPPAIISAPVRMYLPGTGTPARLTTQT